MVTSELSLRKTLPGDLSFTGEFLYELAAAHNWYLLTGGRYSIDVHIRRSNHRIHMDQALIRAMPQ